MKQLRSKRCNNNLTAFRGYRKTNQTAITVQTYCCVSIVSVCNNIFNKVNYAVSIVCVNELLKLQKN